MKNTELHILYTDENKVVWMEDAEGRTYDLPNYFDVGARKFTINETCDAMFVTEDNDELTFFLKNIENEVLVLRCHLTDEGYELEEAYMVDVVKTSSLH